MKIFYLTMRFLFYVFFLGGGGGAYRGDTCGCRMFRYVRRLFVCIEWEQTSWGGGGRESFEV